MYPEKSDLKLGECIGDGGFSTVYECTCNGKELALKMLRSTPQSIAQNEVSILKEVNHPNIVTFNGTIETPWPVPSRRPNVITGILTEYCSCDLFTFVQETYDVMVDCEWQRLVVSLSSQLLDAITYLSARNICHGDIKLENLMLCLPECTLKVVDFGMAQRMRDGMATGYRGSLQYVAPELANMPEYDGAAADAWSCGVAIFAMIANQLIYRKLSDPHLKVLCQEGIGPYVARVCSTHRRLSILQRLLPVLSHLLAPCPTDRSVPAAHAELLKTRAQLVPLAILKKRPRGEERVAIKKVVRFAM